MDDSDSFELSTFTPFLLNQAAEAQSDVFSPNYRDRYGMLRTEWRVLFHLGIHGRMTAKDIGERAKIHKTKVSRAVQRLADRRFLTRERDESDRRSEFLELTQAGQAAYRDLRAIAQEYEARLTARFSAEDTALLKRLLVELAR